MSSKLASTPIHQMRLDAERLATDVLAEHWPERTLPIDPIRIARRMGVEVFTAQLGNDVFGLIVGTPGGASIYIDEDQPPNRHRFTAAHELGHFVEHETRAEKVTLDFVDRRSDEDRGQPAEVWANHFAGALLMPKKDLVQRRAEISRDVALAKVFDVSLAALRYRLALAGH